MSNIRISIFNDSTALSDTDVAKAVPDLQVQISQHFAPAWGVDADLTFVPKGQTPPNGSWWLVILDDSDQAGALGYHDTTPQGLPAGKVFAKTDLDNHLSWTVTISHELIEMLGDPDINLTTFIQDTPKTGKLYSYELCDPVEDDQFAYLIGGTLVSDFVLPCYFEPETAGAAVNAKYDYCGHLSAPVPAMLSGGYISAFDVANNAGWTQMTSPTEGQPHRGHLRAHTPGGRAERRRRPHGGWSRSHPRVAPMDGVPPPRVVPMDSAPPPRVVPMDSVPPPRVVPM